jgi:hypothetical protein
MVTKADRAASRPFPDHRVLAGVLLHADPWVRQPSIGGLHPDRHLELAV